MDRLLHTTGIASPQPIDPEIAAFHAAQRVVDLVVGTPLFRPDVLQRRRHGHVDLPRLRAGGVDLVGFTIATRHPDLRGTLSTPHFWSLGLSARQLASDMAIARALLTRIDGWIATSGGQLRPVRTRTDLEQVGRSGGSVSVFVGVQGGHILEGDLANLVELRDRGVVMVAPAHVMDNALVGSNTGRRSGGLTGYGREAVAEIQRLGMLVDLAHMSGAGIRDTLPLVHRPFLLSHTGFTRLSNAGSRIPGRRFTPRNRNLGEREARMVAEAGGVIGLTLSTRLLGGEGLDAVRRAVDEGLALAGPGQLALGSDMDGALRVVCDAAGLPAVTAALLGGGLDRDTVAALLGGNALRILDAALP